MDKKTIMVAGATLVVGIIIGFVGGTQYQKNKTSGPVGFGNPNQLGVPGNMMGNPTRNGNTIMRGGGGVIGEVISKDDTSMTVKLPDGGSRIIFFSGSTTIAKSAQGSIADVVSGTQVVVTGTSNPDGSITAQNIQLRPSGSSVK